MIDHCIVLNGSQEAALKPLCGISVLERLLRTLQRLGIDNAAVLSDSPEPVNKELAKGSWARPQLKIQVCSHPMGTATVEEILTAWPESVAFLIVVRGDFVLDARLLRLLMNQNTTAGLVDSAIPANIKPLVASAPDAGAGKFCGAAVIERDWLISQTGEFEKTLVNGLEGGRVKRIDVTEEPLYSFALRRKVRPFWFPAPSPGQEKAAEAALLDATQKGTLDIPAMIHAPIERFLISYLCRTPITPNQLTFFCNIAAWITTALFATGHLTPGIVLALIVGVLDGLDGKQARIKVETTKSGKLEHWFDAFFEWSWWIALACYFQFSGQLPTALIYFALLIVGEGLDGIAKAVVYFTTGKTIDELGVFERFVRLIGGRRNVYVWTLAIGLLLGAPAKGFRAIAWLAIATALVHLPRAAWIFYQSRHKGAAAPLA